MNWRIFWVSGVFFGVVTGALVWFFKPQPQVAFGAAPAVAQYEIDTSSIKTVADVAQILEVLNIRLGVNLNQATPELARFKKAEKFFKLSTGARPQ